MTNWPTSSTTAGPYSLRTPVRTRSSLVYAVLATDELAGANFRVVGEVAAKLALVSVPTPVLITAVLVAVAGAVRYGFMIPATFALPRTCIAVVRYAPI